MTYAPLTNMAVCHQAMLTLMKRPDHLPGMGTMSGPSGYGKSVSAAYTTARTKAVYLEARSTWTIKSFLLTGLKELGVEPAKTNAEMTVQFAEALAMSRRPMIIDEVDHIVNKRFVEVIRDIYEISHAAILLIGEEHMPDKLKSWERFDNRILEHVRAQPASLDDAILLRDLYCTNIEVADDLVKHFQVQCKGVVRRICVNLERAQELAKKKGQKTCGIEDWGTTPVFVGRPPVRKAA